MNLMGKNEKLQYVINNLDGFEDSERLKIFQDAYYMADLGFSNVDINKIKEIFKGYIPPLPKELQDKEIITVYRGGTEYGLFYKRAMSWTLDFNVAEFFANRDPREAKMRHVAKAEIPKKYILDYNNDRQEQEILLIPDKIENISHVDFKVWEWTKEEKNAALTTLYVQNQF